MLTYFFFCWRFLAENAFGCFYEIAPTQVPKDAFEEIPPTQVWNGLDEIPPTQVPQPEVPLPSPSTPEAKEDAPALPDEEVLVLVVFSLIGYYLLQGFNEYTVSDLVLAPYRLMRSRRLDLLWQRKWNLASQWRLLWTWAQKPKLLSKQLGWIANVQIQGHGIQALNPKELLYLSVCIIL